MFISSSRWSVGRSFYTVRFNSLDFVNQGNIPLQFKPVKFDRLFSVTVH